MLILRGIADCAALCISAVPAIVLLAVHYCDGHRPTEAALLKRVARYGVDLLDWRAKPRNLLTFMFVHLNDDHLMSNLGVMALNLMAWTRMSSPSSIPTIPRRRNQAGYYYNSNSSSDDDDDVNDHEEELGDCMYTCCTLYRATLRTAGAMVVFVLGSLGGLAAQVMTLNQPALHKGFTHAFMTQACTFMLGSFASNIFTYTRHSAVWPGQCSEANNNSNNSVAEAATSYHTLLDAAVPVYSGWLAHSATYNITALSMSYWPYAQQDKEDCRTSEGDQSWWSNVFGTQNWFTTTTTTTKESESSLGSWLSTIWTQTTQSLRRLWPKAWHTPCYAVGASGGIFALSAFHATYTQQPIALLALLVMEAAMVNSSSSSTNNSKDGLFSDPLSPIFSGNDNSQRSFFFGEDAPYGSSSNDFLSRTQDALKESWATAWRWLPDMSTHVQRGTAAHLGGMATGVVLALLWRFIEYEERRIRNERQRRRRGRRGRRQRQR